MTSRDPAFSWTRFAWVCGLVSLLAIAPVQAQPSDETLSAARSCMRAWGQHPFTDTPPLRTVSGSVRVMGRGPAITDRAVTDFPVLVVVQPGVNVMGGSEIELLNPNGWYCLRAAVNVMGGMDIKLHCNAKLASATSGTTVMSGENDAKGISVMGAITVQRVGCQGA